MLKKSLILLAVAALLALSCGVAMAGTGPHQPQGFSAVAMHPTAVAKLKAQGKPIKVPFPNSINQGRKFVPGGDVIPALTTANSQNVLVIFVEFQNDPPGGPKLADRFPLSYFDDMLFGTTYDPPEFAPYHAYYGPGVVPIDRTLKKFYSQNSYGAVTVTTANLPSVLGWVRLSNTYEYYCNNRYGEGAFPHNVPAMVKEAVQALDPVIDFSTYAVNGEVPNLFVVHAGSGAEWNSDPRLIWSHSWSLSYGGDGPLTVDDVIVDSYATMPEVGGDTTNRFDDPSFTGPFPPTVGVFAHEYAHVLGVPDQYDYGYQSEGTGPFSLMAGGSWNRYPFDNIFAGNSPSNLDAWSKYRLGFVAPTLITSFTTGTLRPAELFPDVFKMVVPNSGGKEYYLFENRQHLGFDQGLLSWGATTHGLAIYHIDDVVLSQSYWRPNENETWKEMRFGGYKHYGISLIQADDYWELEKGAWVTNAPYSGDLYPGKWQVHSFGSYTFPNSTSYYFWAGSDPAFGYSGVTVDNIVENGGIIDADFNFIPWVPVLK